MKITKEELKTMIVDTVKEATRPPLIKDGEDAASPNDLTPEPELTPFQRKFPNIKLKRFDGVPNDEFSFIRAINGIKNKRLTGFEKEVIEFSTQQRALATDESSTYGGYFIGEEFLPEQFIAFYRAASICRAAGVRVLPCNNTPVSIPKVTGSVNTYWLGENSSITLSDLTPSQLQLTPHLLAARSQLSKTLIRTSQMAAENIIREDMAGAVAAAEDLAIMEGTGSSNQPTGMSATSSINEVEIGTNGGAITFNFLRDMETALLTDDIKMMRPAFLMHPRTWGGICKLEKDSKFVINPGQQDATRRMLLGYPVFLSSQISIDLTKGTGTALANIFLVDMQDIILAEWGGIEIDLSEEGDTAWAQYAVQVRIVKTLDVGVRNAESICLINDSTT